jgi:hypothetical protein
VGKAVDSKESFKRDPQALRFSLAGIIEEHVQDFEDPSGFFADHVSNRCQIQDRG